MKTIAFSSLKGGTGKSSLAILSSNFLAAAGRKVLCVDLDIQNSMSFYYVNNREMSDSRNLAIALNVKDARRGIVESNTERIHIMPSSARLSDFRSIQPSELKDLLESVSAEYDFCIIDTPPTFDGLVVAAITAADEIIIPTRLSFFDYKSIHFYSEKIEKLGRKWSILINFYRQQNTSNDKNIKNQTELLFRTIFSTILPFKIPEMSMIQKAIDTRDVITEAKSKERAFQAIQTLCEYLAGAALETRRF